MQQQTSEIRPCTHRSVEGGEPALESLLREVEKNRIENFLPSSAPDAPVVGIDMGIASFLTTSTGKTYGTMQGKLKERHRRDREKRRRKAKLRACLKKKGKTNRLPSTSSRSGKKLIRHTKQQINRAVNQCYNDPDHQGVHFASFF